MCSNYEAPEQLDTDFASLPATFEYKREQYPGYFAPILLPLGDDPEELAPMRAMYGMVPHWAKDAKLARMTYNARSETVQEKSSFKNAWKKRQLCLIPAQSFYEPNYESGKPIRWRIRRADNKAFALAGIYETRTDFEDPTRKMRSFSMLTISGEGHPIMQRMHAPEDEKRSVVLLQPQDYTAWLTARDESEVRELLRPFDPAEYVAEAAPRPPRSKMEGRDMAALSPPASNEG